MDVYPLNLILAVATASATIFLGFLPTKTIRSAFFATEALRAAYAWLLVAAASPPAILHYHLFFALLCGGAWWKFRHDNALSGKMWLSVASGLGISIGIMLILAVTPRANPPGLPQMEQALLVASIYLGGAVIGLAYVGYTLTQNVSTNSGVTNAVVQRYVGLLLFLTLARATVLLIEPFVSGSGTHTLVVVESQAVSPFRLRSMDALLPNFALCAGILTFLALVLVILAFLTQRATQFNSRILPTRYLVGLILLGFVAEILARHLVL